MLVSEKIRTINNKVTQTKKQLSSVLSSGNIIKYKFLTSEDVLTEKDLSEKAATIKRFENSPLGSELTKRTSIEKD